MASVESIGACSLDFETSATDNFLTRKDLTASECTLHSTNGLTPSIKESSRNGLDLQDELLLKEQRFGIHTYFILCVFCLPPSLCCGVLGYSCMKIIFNAYN